MNMNSPWIALLSGIVILAIGLGAVFILSRLNRRREKSEAVPLGAVRVKAKPRWRRQKRPYRRLLIETPALPNRAFRRQRIRRAHGFHKPHWKGHCGLIRGASRKGDRS